MNCEDGLGRARRSTTRWTSLISSGHASQGVQFEVGGHLDAAATATGQDHAGVTIRLGADA